MRFEETRCKQKPSFIFTNTMEIAIRANQKVIEEQVSNVLVYRGWADPGVLTSEDKWQIRRFTINSGTSIWDWADGNDNADNIWDNRASLSYS